MQRVTKHEYIATRWCGGEYNLAKIRYWDYGVSVLAPEAQLTLQMINKTFEQNTLMTYLELPFSAGRY